MHKDTGGPAVNPYQSQGFKGEAWRRGYEGKPMLAYPASNYSRFYKEGQKARKRADAMLAERSK